MSLWLTCMSIEFCDVQFFRKYTFVFVFWGVIAASFTSVTSKIYHKLSIRVIHNFSPVFTDIWQKFQSKIGLTIIIFITTKY